MSQEYNVDDILAEVRRKKNGEAHLAAAPKDTYGAPERGARRPETGEAVRRQGPSRLNGGSAVPARTPSERQQPRRPAAPYQETTRAPRRPEPSYEPPKQQPPTGRFSFDAFGVEPKEKAESMPPAEEFSFGGERFAPEESAFSLPGWGEPEPEERFDFGGGEDLPRPVGGTRMDLPTQPLKEERAWGGFTQELDTPPRLRTNAKARRTAEPEDHWGASQAGQESAAPEGELTSPADIPAVRHDLKSIRVGLNVKLVLTTALTLVSLYLALSMRVLPFAKQLGLDEGYMLSLPKAIFPEENMRLFLIVNLVLLVLGAIICSSIVGGGIAALCRLRANSDSPAAVAVLAVLIQGAMLIVLPDGVYENENVSLYFCVAMLGLICCLLGKKMMMKRISRNFEFLAGEGEKYAFLQIGNREFAREFSRGLGPDVDRVAYSAKTGFLTGFLDKSYAADYSEAFSAFTVPVSLVGALAVAIGSYFLGGGELTVSVSAFAAVLCICAPFSSNIIPNLMQGKMAKKLEKKGAMIAGYESAEEFSETGAVIISDKELFFSENVMLHGMKVFAEKRIDEAILDAASVILSCDGIMSGVFLNMIGGNRSLLKKVDNLMYEDGMGLSAWVDGKRVLIGSNELMQNHSIDCPSKDFEKRYVRDGRRVLYIANSGELTAMFVVSYNPDQDTADQVAQLQRMGIALAVYTTDPNVTGDLISSAFGIKRGGVRVLPAKLHPDYNELVEPKEYVNADGAHSGGLDGILQLVKAAAAIKKSVMSAAVVQLVGVIVGYGLVTFMAFTKSLSLASFGTLLVFGLVWLAITSIAANIVKR